MTCDHWKVGLTSITLNYQRMLPAVALHESMLRFIVDQKNNAGIDIVVREECMPVPDPADLLFDSGSIWKVYRWEKGIFYTFRTPDGTQDLGRGLFLDMDKRKGVLFLPPSPLNNIPGYALSYPLGELLFQHHAARTGAMVVHACGFECEGRTVLFCGESGAGKTTLAHLWRHHRPQNDILSDDRILIQVVNGNPFGFGTPWHGEGQYSAPEGHPIAAIFFIRHARQLFIDPLSRSTAASELMARSFYPPWEADAIQAVIKTSSQICDQICCSRLSFTPDYSVIEGLESFLETHVFS